MTDQKTKALRFFVSREFVDIAADAIAAHTKKTCRFSSLRDALETSCERLSPQQIDTDDVLAFLRTARLEGDIRVHLNMYASWTPRYEDLKAAISDKAGDRVFDWVAIAYLLHISIRNEVY